jgi:MFS transporter, MHS family, alpha-ketoglutarate permease
MASSPAFTPQSTTASNTISPRRALTALGLGGTLEWYDWQIFGLLAAFLGPQSDGRGRPAPFALGRRGTRPRP